jgi:hypothetical protein
MKPIGDWWRTPRHAGQVWKSALLGIAAVTMFTSTATAQVVPGQNLLPNPSFESVEPPPPTPETAKTGAPQDQWRPRTWDVAVPPGVQFRCPDDPAMAHTGRRCVYFNAPAGLAMLRYGPMPVCDAQPWTVKVWARGTGTLVLVAADWTCNQQLKRTTLPLTNAWTEVALEFAAPATCEKWWLDVTHEGPAEFRLDDASITHAGFTPVALPPEKPLSKDEHTLLYLPCEDLHQGEKDGEIQFLVLDGIELLSVGHVEQSKDREGRFGKAMGLWPGSSLLCSANQYLNPTSGTVEAWIKLRTPSDDGISQHFIGVPGPDGMYFGKHIYGQVTLSFSAGWQGLCGASTVMNPPLQPAVWRHFVACWDPNALEVFVDGKLIAWQARPHVAYSLGGALTIGGSNWGEDRGSFDFDDLRISDFARYHWPLRTDPQPGQQKP